VCYRGRCWEKISFCAHGYLRTPLAGARQSLGRVVRARLRATLPPLTRQSTSERSWTSRITEGGAPALRGRPQLSKGTSLSDFPRGVLPCRKRLGQATSLSRASSPPALCDADSGARHAGMACWIQRSGAVSGAVSVIAGETRRVALSETNAAADSSDAGAQLVFTRGLRSPWAAQERAPDAIRAITSGGKGREHHSRHRPDEDPRRSPTLVATSSRL
jgi:hypothetical protein